MAADCNHRDFAHLSNSTNIPSLFFSRPSGSCTGDGASKFCYLAGCHVPFPAWWHYAPALEHVGVMDVSAPNLNVPGAPSGLCAFTLRCGVIAGVTVVVSSLIFGGLADQTLGSSGAILGVLVGYAIVFPDRTLLFGFLIPMKSKYFVMIIAAVVIFQSFSSVAGGRPTSVAVMAHVGGLAAGYFLLRGKTLYARGNMLAADSYRDYKLRRAKKKFQVYLRKTTGIAIAPFINSPLTKN